MNKLIRLTGFVFCMAALFAMLGGHWAVLQSVAWLRMAVAYSEQCSLGEALGKTFDGKHPCKMCLQIRKNREQEESQQSGAASTLFEKMPDALPVDWRVLAGFVPPLIFKAAPTVPRLRADFIDAPPTPPPRISLAA